MNKRAIIASALLSTQVFASECDMQSVATISQEAEIAFVGKVTSLQESSYNPTPFCRPQSKDAPQCGGKLVTFQVTERLRGDPTAITTAVSEDACYCLGNQWKKGASYLIIAKPNNTGHPGQVIAMNTCHGTGELNGTSRSIARALRAPKQ